MTGSPKRTDAEWVPVPRGITGLFPFVDGVSGCYVSGDHRYLHRGELQHLAFSSPHAAFVWIVVWISFYPVSDSAWILNLSACIKLLLAAGIGVLGIYTAVTKGVANEYTVRSLLPSFDLNSLSYISVIIFNFLGFEVICTYAPTMQNPKKQIPQAIITGGIVIALIYIFSAFGIGVAIPTSEICHELRSDRQFQPAAFRSRRTGGYGADHRRSSVPADFIRKYDFLVFRGKQRSGLCGG